MASKKIKQTFDEFQQLLNDIPNKVEKENKTTYTYDSTESSIWNADLGYNAWKMWYVADETTLKNAISGREQLDAISASTVSRILSSSGSYCTIPITKLDFNKAKYRIAVGTSRIRHMVLTLSDGTVICAYNEDKFSSYITPLWQKEITKENLKQTITWIKNNKGEINSKVTDEDIEAENVFYVCGTVGIIKDYTYTMSQTVSFYKIPIAKQIETFSLSGLKSDATYGSIKSPLLSDQITNIGERLYHLENSDADPANTHILNLDNIDRIGVIGDSYTESHFTIKNKAWVNKVSMFTDWNIENFAVSGDTFRGQLNKIRQNINRYYSFTDKKGYGWKDVSPTFALLDCRTNDIKYMSDVQYKYDLLAITDTVTKMGAVPIFCTEYHNGGNEALLSLYDDLAHKYGGYVCDDYTATLRNRGKDYAPFWGGSHPGTRTNELEVTPVVKFINEYLPRPYSSIKIFTPRADTALKVDSNTLDSLVYNTIEDRSKIYREVSLSHSCLKNAKMYDNCTDKGNEGVLSDYLKLKNKITLSASSKMLIEFILPSDVEHIEGITLDLDLNFGCNYYLLDSLATPYPSPNFCRRFDIPSRITDVKVGDKFKSSNHGDRIYTVIEIKYDKVESSTGFVDGTILICSNDYSSTATESGTLTRTSDNKVYNYSYSATALSSDYPEGIQKIGHWKRLTGTYISQDQLKTCMCGDKLPLLICQEQDSVNGIKLKRINLKWYGDVTKTKATCTNRNSLYPYLSDASKDITKTFTTKLSSITPADGCIPGYTRNATIYNLSADSADYEIRLSPTNIYQKIYYNKKIILGVQARYFPDIYDSSSSDTPPVTETSFDYKTIKFKIWFGNNTSGKYFEIDKLVGMHWSDVEIPIILTPNTGNIIVQVYTEDDKVQITDQNFIYSSNK